MNDTKIGFIGAGVMAESLIRGMLSKGLLPPDALHAADPSEERRRAVGALIGDNVGADNLALADVCRTVILAVKPNVLPAVAAQVAERFRTGGHLLISIAPGRTLSWLEQTFRTDRILRAMPNSPARVGQGASAFCRGPGVGDREAEWARRIFESVGLCIEVREELMDAVTGLSGSGPAYALMVVQALSDGGVKMGLPRSDATRLAAQTLRGAAELVLSTREHPDQLKDAVTTPGGTTIEGLHVLEQCGLRHALIAAVEAATLKSRALSGDQD